MKKRENSVWFQHEGLDRTHMLIAQMHEAFNEYDKKHYHPSLHSKECRRLARKASRALAELYQKIGEVEFPEDT